MPLFNIGRIISHIIQYPPIKKGLHSLGVTDQKIQEIIDFLVKKPLSTEPPAKGFKAKLQKKGGLKEQFDRVFSRKEEKLVNKTDEAEPFRFKDLQNSPELFHGEAQTILSFLDEGAWFVRRDIIDGEPKLFLEVKDGEPQELTIENYEQVLEAQPPEKFYRCEQGVLKAPKLTERLEAIQDYQSRYRDVDVDRYLQALQTLGGGKSLSKESLQEIRQQLKIAVGYLADHAEEFEDLDKPLYIRPEQIQENLGKVDRNVPSLQAKYFGAHIQLNPDETVIIIPKHPDLALGITEGGKQKGTFKKVRAGIEYYPDRPPKLVAYVSMKANDSREVENALREVYIMRELLEREGKLSHEQVGLYAFDTTTKIKMLMPYANRGDLEDVVRSGITTNEQLGIVKGMAKWVQLMHDLNYLNGDIKLNNFLVFEEEGQLALRAFDLGWARKIKDAETFIKGGTPLYMSPEGFRCFANLVLGLSARPVDGKAADIFSLGMTILELKHGFEFVLNIAPVYQNSEGKYVCDEGYFAKVLDTFKPLSALEALSKAMIDREPGRRPNIQLVNDTLNVMIENPDISISEVEAMLNRHLHFHEGDWDNPPDLNESLAFAFLSEEKDGAWLIWRQVHSDGARYFVQEKNQKALEIQEDNIREFKENHNPETFVRFQGSPELVSLVKELDQEFQKTSLSRENLTNIINQLAQNDLPIEDLELLKNRLIVPLRYESPENMNEKIHFTELLDILIDVKSEETLDLFELDM